MSASAKDLPDADLENLIREKHRQALAEPRIGRAAQAAPEMAATDFAVKPSARLGGTPTLAIDPSDRVLPITEAAGRRRGSLVPVIVVVVAVAVVGAVVAWTQQGSGDFALFSSPSAPAAPATDFAISAENKPPVGQSTPILQPAPAPVQQAAPAQSVPAPAAPVQAAPAQPAPAVQQAEKKDEAPVQQKAPEKKTVKPAEKKVKPAEKPKQAAAKPKPAASDEGDASFSTLLNSLTTEAPQQETAAPGNTQPAVQQPATQSKSGAPLPTSTAPSTPGTQLFNP
ncbi:MAG: hypothetical protein HYU58_02595 [Proteobacteria bacterium]|nr:hypothetical protein [Pseudomonadota bacterium]